MAFQVHVRGVTKRYGGTMALRGVTATFREGELVLVEGPNGSGKSTLLGVLGFAIRPTSGTVTIDPEKNAKRADVGWLSHETLAYADLSGRKNLELAAEWYGLDAAEVWGAAQERFQLGAFAERPLRTNSRGQRQRVALAKALLHQPKILLLDEPTTGLDTVGVERLLVVVQEEVEQGAVVVVVAHDVSIFEGLRPRRLHLDRGRAVSFT